MSRRGVAAGGAGVTVVLAAVSAALINELHQGWRWWVAAGAVVILAAALSAYLTLRPLAVRGGDRLGAGAVKAGRDIHGNVLTHVQGSPPQAAIPAAEGDQLGSGAVKAGRDIHGDVKTTTNTAPPQHPSS